MLGGFALGAALASLFGGGALGQFIANALMILAMVLIAVFVWRLITGRRAGAHAHAGAAPALAGAGAGTSSGTQRTAYDTAGNHAFGGNPAARAAEPADAGRGAIEAAARIPAGFDVAGFEKGAKAQFVRLQAAFDKGEAATLKDMLTNDMFAEVDRELKARGAQAHPTEIVTLNAEVIEVTTESEGHWASVRFHGLIREDGSEQAESFDEVWNLNKPIDGSAGWLLAGIQQL
jgi:predicted lipid-binding transport protein (Tim44 family)